MVLTKSKCLGFIVFYFDTAMITVISIFFIVFGLLFNQSFCSSVALKDVIKSNPSSHLPDANMGQF